MTIQSSGRRNARKYFCLLRHAWKLRDQPVLALTTHSTDITVVRTLQSLRFLVFVIVNLIVKLWFNICCCIFLQLNECVFENWLWVMIL